MEAADYSWRIGRDKLEKQVGNRMVVMRGQWERCRQAMIPTPVPCRNIVWSSRVKEPAVKTVGQNLLEFQNVSKFGLLMKRIAGLQ